MSDMFMNKHNIEAVKETMNVTTESIPRFNEVVETIAHQIAQLKHMRELLIKERDRLQESFQEVERTINRINYALSQQDESEGYTDVTP